MKQYQKHSCQRNKLENTAPPHDVGGTWCSPAGNQHHADAAGTPFVGQLDNSSSNPQELITQRKLN